MFQVAVTFAVSIVNCEKSFYSARHIKTQLYTCMNQDRFSNSSILNIERGIPLNNENILNILEKSETYTITLNISI